jgi:hypothetical protein
MIARGFKPVAWVAAIGTAALCCYMLSLQVASERAELSALERRIVDARQDIRALQTELGTRGRLSQLEQWNAEVLALSAPVAGQFLESNLSLARFDVRQRTIADQAQVRMAAAEPAPVPGRPAEAPVRMASLAPATAAGGQAPVAPAPLVRRASLQTAPVTAVLARTPPPAARPRANTLLDAGTLAEINDEARSERSGGGGN